MYTVDILPGRHFSAIDDALNAGMAEHTRFNVVDSNDVIVRRVSLTGRFGRQFFDIINVED
ncbi:hypothetical protein [Saccharopolyspora griseoalba]|uniref:Uncharacterized protein n=1 Tax=Saccharopolyspora griseoalba TaxID=1431848 RepID=A0ABW2LTH8_9PSEU